MTDGWRGRALGLAHGRDEVWLVPAEIFAEMRAGAGPAEPPSGRNDLRGLEAGDGPAAQPQRLAADHALALFDGTFRQVTFALRAFVRDHRLGPSVNLFRDQHLLALLRRQIAVGALVAWRPGPSAGVPPKRAPALRASASSAATAAIPIRRAPPPPPPPASPDDEGPEFSCPGPQAQALREAAAAGVPFCAECQRAAAARAAATGSP